MRRPLIKTLWLRLVVFYLVLSSLTILAGSQQRKPVSKEQEGELFGVLISASQDLYGGYIGEARSKFERAISEIGKYSYPQKIRWMAFDGYGMTLLATGDKEKCLKTLMQAIDEAKGISPSAISRSTCHLGDAHLEFGDLQQAIKYYKESLIQVPDDFDIMLKLGSAFRQAKQFNEARQIIELVIRAKPEHRQAYRYLGNVFLEQGEIEKAVACYEKNATYTEDKDEAAQNFLNAGFGYFNQNEFEKALTLYNRAAEISPLNPLVHTDIGWAKLRLGQKTEAIQSFEKALKLKPSKPVKEYAQKGLKEAKDKK